MTSSKWHMIFTLRKLRNIACLSLFSDILSKTGQCQPCIKLKASILLTMLIYGLNSHFCVFVLSITMGLVPSLMASFAENIPKLTVSSSYIDGDLTVFWRTGSSPVLQYGLTVLPHAHRIALCNVCPLYYKTAN